MIAAARSPVPAAHRNRRRPTGLLPLIGLLLLAPTAAADLGPPIEARLVGEPAPARAGVPYTGMLELTGKGIPVTGLRLGGRGWRVEALPAPPKAAPTVAAPLRVEFTAIPADPDEPLLVVVEAGGLTVTRQLDLSPAHFESMRDGGAGTPLPAGALVATGPGPGRDRPPAPVPSPEEAAALAAAPADRAAPTGRSIRVRGRIAYYRDLTNEWLPADGATVTIYDLDGDADDLLATTATSWDGRFDVTFWWSQLEGEPDLYFTWLASNSVVSVEDATYGQDYGWKSSNWIDYAGSDLQVGDWTAGDQDQHGAMHIMTDLTRAHRWLVVNEGYDLAGIDVLWPDQGSYYSENHVEIHLEPGTTWGEGTHCHEYGHYWMDAYGRLPSHDYCNGICDGGGCGHCQWCPESAAIAWMEGWAEWWEDWLPDHFLATYGLARTFGYDIESIHQCTQDGTPYYYGNPGTTEGFIAALMRDMDDAAVDVHTAYGSSRPDSMSGLRHEVFQVADLDLPESPGEFLASFMARYPSLTHRLWPTAANCGFQVDSAPPGVPAGFTSPSHATTGDSPDATVDLVWGTPSDDASGIRGYSFAVATGAPQPPDLTLDIPAYNVHETDALAPGTYWFTLRAQDRAGNWSGGYATYGPVTIRAAEPADLAWNPHTVWWTYPLVPRQDQDATINEALLPDTLVAGLDTYWNARGWNEGEQTTSQGIYLRLYRDGGSQDIGQVGLPAVTPSGGFAVVDQGPVTVGAGRHTLHAFVDALEQVPETDETNNRWGHQFVWRPSVRLGPGQEVTFSWLPDLTGGWQTVVDGSPLFYNCEALRFPTSGWWHALEVHATDDTTDYDCRLHQTSGGAEEGFEVAEAWAARLAGCVDAVIVNNLYEPAREWDAGLVSFTPGSLAACKVRHLTETAIDCGDELSLVWQQDDHLLLYGFLVWGDWLGGLTVYVEGDPADGPFHAGWLPESFTVGDLTDAALIATSDTSGTARLDLVITQQSYNGLVVFRDPIDGAPATDLTIRIVQTPPDYVAVAAPGWHGPVVPRPAADASEPSCPAPDTLYGAPGSTWLNLTALNESVEDPGGLYADLLLDGDLLERDLLDGVPPGGWHPLVNLGPRSIPGGRHTLGLRLDASERIEELDETNNAHAEQWVWSPQLVLPGETRRLPAPPPMTGGWQDVAAGPIRYNCDGLRLDAGRAVFYALAVLPGDTSDVDLRLHLPAEGAREGFDVPLASSSWGMGQTDFLWLRPQVAGRPDWDVGVTRWRGEQAYEAAAVASTRLPGDGPGEYGPFPLGEDELLHLWHLDLPPGVWRFRLLGEGDQVDLGFSLHPSWPGGGGKSDVLDGAIAWLAPPGAVESFVVAVEEPDVFGLAVWRTGAADREGRVEYFLIVDEPTGLPPDGTPAVTRLRAPYPNPFNPQVRVAFDLARDGRVRLEVYDLQGRLVRRLLDARLASGRHDAVWDGCDRGGRSAASGTYLLRLQADGEIACRRVTLVR